MRPDTKIVRIQHGRRELDVRVLTGDQSAPPMTADHCAWYVGSAFRNDKGQPILVLPEWRGFLEAIFDIAIWLILISTPRQQGKTQIVMAVLRYIMLHARDQYFAAVANAKDQVGRFIRQKIKNPMLHENSAIRDLMQVLGAEVRVPRLSNAMMILPTNQASSVGSSADKIYFDEARDIPDQLFEEIWPAVLARQDFKLIVTSTVGRKLGFFWKLVEMQLNEPDPGWYLFYTKEFFNPLASREKVRRLSAAGSRASELRNLYNEPADEGDELLSRESIDAAIDDELHNLDPKEVTGEVWVFVDTSSTKALTSLVAVERPKSEEKRLRVVRIVSWDPEVSPGGVIDQEAVKKEIEFVLAKLRPTIIEIDNTSGHGVEILSWARRERYFEVQEFRATAQTNMGMWGAFRQTMQGRECRIPRHKRLIDELYGLKTQSFNFGQSWRVIDPNKMLHREISFSLARAVHLAVEAWSGGESEISDFEDTWEKWSLAGEVSA